MSVFNIFKRKNTPLTRAVKNLRRNEIVMTPKACKGVKKPYDTKIGGMPYLFKGFDWPTYTDPETGVCRHLSFFCQVNLSDVKPFDKDGLLPPRGMLYFFYECESMRWGFDVIDEGAARVIYVDTADRTDLEPIPVPDDVAEDYLIPEIPLAFKAAPSYPYFEEFDLLEDFDEVDFEEYDEILEGLGVNVDEDIECHKLLGYANIIQNEMLTEVERTSRGLDCGSPDDYQNTPANIEDEIEKCAKDWVLLCQLSTVETEDFEFMFGDCGMIYFYIRKQDLAVGDFSKVRFSVQCG